MPERKTSIQKAKEAIDADKKRRSQNCLTALEKALKENRCQVLITGRISGPQAETEINFIPLD